MKLVTIDIPLPVISELTSIGRGKDLISLTIVMEQMIKEAISLRDTPSDIDIEDEPVDFSRYTEVDTDESITTLYNMLPRLYDIIQIHAPDILSIITINGLANPYVVNVSDNHAVLGNTNLYNMDTNT